MCFTSYFAEKNQKGIIMCVEKDKQTDRMCVWVCVCVVIIDLI